MSQARAICQLRKFTFRYISDFGWGEIGKPLDNKGLSLIPKSAILLNAVTPFIMPDPPWLANLPLVIAIMTFLLAFGLSHIRAERARAAKAVNPNNRKSPSNGWQGRMSRG